MKNFVAFLLCLCAILSLSSCQNPRDPIGSDVKDPPSSDGTPSQTVAYYSDVIRLYKLAVRACVDEQLGGYSSSAEMFGITDTQEKLLLEDLQYGVYMRLDIGSGTPDSSSPIYKLSCGYAQKDLNGDGVDELVLLDENYTIMSIFSYADGKPIMIGGPDEAVFSDRPALPDCWIDGEGVIHASTLYGFDHAWAYRIAEDGKSLEAIADYSLTLYAGGITKYYSSVSGEAVEITKKEYNELEAKYSKYLGKYSGNEATRDYSGLKFVPLFSEAELIEEIYQSALDNKTKVYDVETEEYKFLKGCKAPYGKTYLSDVPDLKYAFVDFDGDGIGEPVIGCGGRIVLRYYNRRVYAYSLAFRHAYDLKTDGSFDWNHNGERFEYGSNQIYFEGAELKIKELWRIVDDGQPNAEYYIDGKRVSHEEILEYFERNPKTNVDYSPIDKTWYDRISLEEAYEIAKDHLRFRDEPDGAAGKTIVPKLIEIDMPDDESVYYHFLWINEYYDHRMEGWENRAPYSMEVHKEVLVDVTTGECIVLNIRDYYNFGSSIAIDKVRDYLGINTGVPEINGETKIYSSLKVVDFPHCEVPYYRIAYIRIYCHCSEDGTEDEAPYKRETVKEIFVNSKTGECLERPESVSAEEAIEIAKKYWEAFNIEENGYRVEHAFNSWASDSVYVIVIKRFVIDHYSTFDEIWIDKTTGATIVPYDPDGTPSQTVAYYSDVIRLYKLAVRACVDEQLGGYSSSAEMFGITDTQEKLLLEDLQYGVYMRLDIGSGTPDSSSPIYKLSCGYAQKDLNGDGVDELVLLDENYTIMSIFSYADGKPIMIGGPDEAVFSDRPALPDCWIDGEGVIHASTLYGFDHAWAYRIAEDGKSLEAIADYSLTLYAGGITKYYSSVSGEAVEITKKEYNELEAKYSKYLGKYSGNEATRDYSGLKFVPLFSEAELIEEIYQSALDNKTKVYDVETEEYKFLKGCKAPYGKTYLSDVPDLKYAFVDFDGDGIGEPVIGCGGRIVLRYYNRRVYAYSLAFRHAYDLKTDGSFDWNHNGERFEYGSNQIYFEGAELKIKELWRIVDDGQPNAEYYIDGKRVSHEEILEYFERNPKTNVDYSPIDKTWYDRISLEEAYEIAKDHLRFRDEPDGAAGKTIVPKLIEIDMPDDESVYYHFLWINEYYDHRMEGWENRAPYSMEVHKEVLVDVTTGECIVLNIRDYYNFGSSIAIDKVRDYLGINTGVPEINGETKIYSSLKVVDFPHCEVPYYRIAYIRIYCHCSEDGTEDEAPYKTETVKEIFVNSKTGECLERPDGTTGDKG